MKKTSNFKNPRLNQLPGIEIDGANPPLSFDEEIDFFMAKYMKEINPVKRYEKYFQGSSKEVGRILKEIRRHYGKIVLKGSWNERKYISILDEIFKDFTEINEFSLDHRGLAYEKRMYSGRRK